MWQRKNFSDCADELEQVSEIFREGHLEKDNLRPHEREEAMRDASVKGRDLLDILALTIRRELDDKTFDLPNPKPIVGFIKSGKSVLVSEQDQILKNYHRPNLGSNGFIALHLRTALNKIAHARRNQTGFYVEEKVHDVILCGKEWNRKEKKVILWIAVISIIDLCEAVRNLRNDIDRPNAFGSSIYDS